MTQPALLKVTVFVMRSNTKLLLFRHPHAGIQLPAGTVEDETPQEAARREVQEETGIHTLLRLHQIACDHQTLTDPRHVILRTTEVHLRPDLKASHYARLRRGLAVERLRQQNNWYQIEFTEWDRFSNPQYLSSHILGWVPAESVTQHIERRFFVAQTHEKTPDRWNQQADGHTFALFWASLDNLPEIVEPQQHWLQYIKRWRDKASSKTLSL